MNMHFFTDLIAVKCEIFLTNIAFPVVRLVPPPVNVSSRLMQNVKYTFTDYLSLIIVVSFASILRHAQAICINPP